MQKQYVIISLILLIIIVLYPLKNIQTVEAAPTLEIGDYVEFGSYKGESILWRVINFDYEGDPLLYSEHIVALKAFDASGEFHSPTNSERVTSGSNDWFDSTIRHWLNSEEEMVSWTKNPPSETNVSNHPYDTEEGFLSDENFTKIEQDAIKPVTHKALLAEVDKGVSDGGVEGHFSKEWYFPNFYPSVDEYVQYMTENLGAEFGEDYLQSIDQNNDGVVDFPVYITNRNVPLSESVQNYDRAYFHHVTDKVFFLSVKELKEYVHDRGWNHQASMKPSLLNEMSEKIQWMGNFENFSYWLRTPATYTSHSVRTVSDSGDIKSSTAYSGWTGVRPAMYIDSDAVRFKSGDGNAETPFRQEGIDISFDKEKVVLKQGFSEAISYSLSDKMKDKITWTSLNNNVATVSERGLVTGVGPGETVIIATTTSGAKAECKVTVLPTDYKVANVIKSVIPINEGKGTVDTIGRFIAPFSNLAGGTSEFFDQHGRYHVVYEGRNNVYITIFDRKMKETDTLTIKKELPLFGAATFDGDGNYYILWGEEVVEEAKQTQSIQITKYNSDGQNTESVEYAAGEINVKIPFDAGNADLVYGNGIVTAHFAREMFKLSDGLNHQASKVLYADAKTMEPLDLPQPYVSHSFDQQVIATSDGGFLFIDRGDGYPRGFQLSKVLGDKLEVGTTFHFREGMAHPYGYNYTFSQLGGIAEGDSGYILVGASEKTLSGAPAPKAINEARNVFIQIVKKDFKFDQFSAEKNKMNFITKGESRRVNGTREGQIGSYFLTQDTEDHGVVWLTNYMNSEDAANPKVVSTEDGRFVVMWEHFKNLTFKNTYYTVLSSHGEVLEPITVLENTRLSTSEQPVYKDGKIYWSVVENEYDNYTRSFESRLEVFTLDLKRKEGVDKGESTVTYDDFKDGEYWSEHMLWSIENGLLKGYINEKHPATQRVGNWLNPYGTLTEAQFLTIMFRYTDAEELNTIEPLDPNYWASTVYQLAGKYNLPTKSTVDNRVYASKPITRGDMARILASKHFGKVISEREAVQFMYDAGLSNGYPDKNGNTPKTYESYGTKNILARAHIVTFMRNYDTYLNNN